MRAALALAALLSNAALTGAAPYLSSPFALPTTIKAGMFDTVRLGTFYKLADAANDRQLGPDTVTDAWLIYRSANSLKCIRKRCAINNANLALLKRPLQEAQGFISPIMHILKKLHATRFAAC
jgi:hypothetical protein